MFLSTQWERQEQCALVKWFRLKYRDVLIDATPNPGKMDAQKGAIMKAEGLLRGSPDLRIYKSCRGYHGLFIELKLNKSERHAKGVLSDAQKQCLKQLNDEGYYAVACWGWIAGKEIIDWYLGEKEN